MSGNDDDKNKTLILLSIIGNKKIFEDGDDSGSSSDSDNSDEYIPSDEEKENKSILGKRRLRNTDNNDSSIKLPSKKRHCNFSNDPHKYYYNLDPNLFKIETITDFINLALKYEPEYIYNNDFFKKMFKLIPSMIKLDGMIGMQEIKIQILHMVMYFLQGYHNSGHFLNSVIYGNPGVGKTVVAEILARIYADLGFLKNSNVVFAKKSDFVGKYVGQTIPRTIEFLDKCRGSVVVIDEVYAFGANKDNQSEDIFSKEAVDTINQYLSEHKGEIIVIVIGYKKEVDECFFSINQGLCRRFPENFRYTINNYKSDELCLIFKSQISRTCEWHLRTEDEEKILKLLERTINENKGCFNDNGGSTENLILLVKKSQAYINFGKNNLHKSNNNYEITFEGFEMGLNEYIIKYNKLITEDIYAKVNTHMYT